MIFAALTEAADRNELLIVSGGLCRFHRRKDGVVVIHEIIVLPDQRRRGIGKELVRTVLHVANGPVRALCPVEYEGANAFWQAMGFSLLKVQTTVRGKQLNLWEHSG